MITGARPFGKFFSLKYSPKFWLEKKNFRAIYDNDEHVAFLDKLDQRIKHHNKDIERLCNVYYQGFIESIRELLEVRSQAKKLNVTIVFC